ncbi:glycosyltransferase [uncultured Fusobacterium sp.]|uniref:glycosyltransferase n=1 Tax=uncultured Fusobacterium sp. TaxID=159267 RepID=UPI0026145852|nr:glycosyltransferase [uncultured Fusobacterium sp.]
MKRLAIVNHNLGSGGAEKLIYDMTIELQKRGIDFSVILLTSVNCIYGKRLLEKGIDVIYLSDRWDIYSPKNIFRLIKVLKDYDIIHTHIYSAQLWTVIASLYLDKKKIYITTEHSNSNNRRGRVLFKLIDRMMYSRYSNIACITSKVRDSLVEWIGNNDKFRVIENGIDIDSILSFKERTRKELGFKEDDILLCQIARLNIVKNHETSFKALKELPQKYKLILLGEGERKDELLRLAEQLGISDRVYFLGYRDDVYGVLKAMNISLLTSQYEGLPISCLESMLLVPFIGSRVPGIKEVVAGYGELFELNNHLELKDLILKVVEDRELYEKLKRECNKRATEYSIKKCVDKYIEVYEGR